MMRMEHRLVQTQTQRLMLTQKMQQALQILQYSSLELEHHVQQELETNPVLEQLPAEEELLPVREENTGNGHDSETFDDKAFDLDEYESRWEQRIKEGRDFSINMDLAARRDYYENSITREESLSAHLLRQARMAFTEPDAYALGERIIGEINGRGYFTASLEEIAGELSVPLPDVERTLFRIQKFEPTGIGARNVVECLLLQINAEYPKETELRRLVDDHLEDLENRRIPKIARAMKITPERVEALRTLLSTLDPWPGLEYSSEPTQYIVPELIVEKIEGEYVVYLASDGMPDLKLSDHYRTLAKDKTIPKEEKKYLREKMESARWLIRNIEQRRDTILRIGTAIMDVQREFLDRGVDRIKPLTLQEIADVVGVHEATVSRTTRGKYIQTPQGLFELKYFFSPGLKSSSGEMRSSKSVQSQIKRIIKGENKLKPLSDQKIADQLKDKGLTIARRTVTKYREGMGIPTTTLRKEY